jgi:hypothetical protein
MTVLDIISIIPDSSETVIYDTEANELARYDGKDSIPNEYNDREVRWISPTKDGKLAIEIKD